MPPSKTILVTGATGFIGRRLTVALLERGHKVRALTRSSEAPLPAGVLRFVGNLLEADSLAPAFEGADCAYFLVHSLGEKDFTARDRAAAINFIEAGRRAALQRGIYLGGLGEKGASLSNHLASRREVADILGTAPFPVTVLRAAVIIGAGGASFELIRSLVTRLPLIPVPASVDTRCEPIAVGDVVRYLWSCLEDERTIGKVYDIGGPEVLTYHQLLERVARVAGKTNLYIPLPMSTPSLFARGAALVAAGDDKVNRFLVEGLGNEVVCEDRRIRKIFPFPLTPLDEAIQLALDEESGS